MGWSIAGRWAPWLSAWLLGAPADPDPGPVAEEIPSTRNLPAPADSPLTWLDRSPFVRPKVTRGATWGVQPRPHDVSDVRALDHTIQRYTGQLNYCYERALRDDPFLERTLTIRWELHGRRPQDVVHVGPSHPLADCVIAKIQRWSFPSDSKGEVTQPFTFSLEPRPPQVPPIPMLHCTSGTMQVADTP